MPLVSNRGPLMKTMTSIAQEVPLEEEPVAINQDTALNDKEENSSQTQQQQQLDKNLKSSKSLKKSSDVKTKKDKTATGSSNSSVATGVTSKHLKRTMSKQQKELQKQKTRKLKREIAIQQAKTLKQQEEVLNNIEALLQTQQQHTLPNFMNEDDDKDDEEDALSVSDITSEEEEEDEEDDEEKPEKDYVKKSIKNKNKRWQRMLINQQKNLDILTDLYVRQWAASNFGDYLVDDDEETEGDKRARIASSKGQQKRESRFLDAMRRHQPHLTSSPSRQRYRAPSPYPTRVSSRRFDERSDDEEEQENRKKYKRRNQSLDDILDQYQY
ncbi:golgin subfamily A member 6-like protein 25 [Montipora foliosa]|uniref:golgin subfamily A member 6-like protein 25 n=1 Tax=Montipora foliosa TaxID=591990 RepID=UPI0035F1B6C7